MRRLIIKELPPTSPSTTESCPGCPTGWLGIASGDEAVLACDGDMLASDDMPLACKGDLKAFVGVIESMLSFCTAALMLGMLKETGVRLTSLLLQGEAIIGDNAAGTFKRLFISDDICTSSGFAASDAGGASQLSGTAVGRSSATAFARLGLSLGDDLDSKEWLLKLLSKRANMSMVIVGGFAPCRGSVSASSTRAQPG
jgi:hypothetical protein